MYAESKTGDGSGISTESNVIQPSVWIIVIKCHPDHNPVAVLVESPLLQSKTQPLNMHGQPEELTVTCDVLSPGQINGGAPLNVIM